MLTLPGGGVYYVPGTGRARRHQCRRVLVGTDEWLRVTLASRRAGWVSATHRRRCRRSFDDDNDETPTRTTTTEPPPNIHLVNSTAMTIRGTTIRVETTTAAATKAEAVPEFTATDLPQRPPLRSRRAWFSSAQDSQVSPVSDGVVGIADRDDAPKRKRLRHDARLHPHAPAANAH